MTQPKYTQETILEIEDFFQSNFKQKCINRVQSGPSKGSMYLSYRYLNPEQRNLLEEFSANRFGNSFKNVQTSINQRIKKGSLFVGEQKTEQSSEAPDTVFTNVIVKCSKLVRENKMTHSDMCEVLENLYP